MEGVGGWGGEVVIGELGLGLGGGTGDGEVDFLEGYTDGERDLHVDIDMCICVYRSDRICCAISADLAMEALL